MPPFRLSALSSLAAAIAFASPVLAAAPKGNPFAENVRPTEALTPDQEQKSFHLPPGFQIQLVASEPQINKPINITFDARGRLWVTSTVEYPLPVKADSPTRPRDSIKILEIDPATGRATKVTTFADGLNIPTGVYPYKNGCIAYSIPNIYWLEDTNGDGIADKREVLYGPFDTTRDTHGMTNSFTRGFDGGLYATHGFNNITTLKGKDGSSIEMKSGSIYRMALDGSHVDLITHGPVNPFGLAYDSSGNLYVADCHTKPFQSVLRGAWFEHFGRPHDGIGFYPKIMGHLHGSTAIGGVISIDDDRWPREFQGNLICGNPVTSRVDRDSLTFAGSTPTAHEQPDFVASDDPWFRPVAFALSPDGSIYMADFYNKIIGHYEVPLTHPGRDRERGRIWRIIPPKTAQNASADFAPHLTVATAADLAAALNHPNLAGRMMAADQLVDRIGPAAIPVVRPLLSSDAPRQKAHALWVLQRLGALKPEELAAAARTPDLLLRAHAARIFGELPALTPDQRKSLFTLTTDADALVRRCAVESLARHPSEDNLRPILDVIHTALPEDTHLTYAARIALRAQLELPGLIAKLPLPNWADPDDAAIASVLPAIPSAESANYLARLLDAKKIPPASQPDAIKHICRFGGDAQTASALDFAITAYATNPDQLLALLKALQEGTAKRGGKLPEKAATAAADAINAIVCAPKPNALRATAAIDLARTMSLKQCAPGIADIMRNPKSDPALRGSAIKTLLALAPAENLPLVIAIVANTDQPIALRDAAAKALSEVNSDEARQALLMPIRTAPHAVAVKLAAALASRPEGANTLIDAIERKNLSPRILQEQNIRDRLVFFGVKDVDARIAKLTKNLAPVSAELDKLIAAKRAAYTPAKIDLVHGKEVFTKTCAICHQLEGQGALVGPQLDGAGARGLDRLLEDVIDPNRNVDPMFRYVNITLKDGNTISGLPRKDEGKTITLIDATGKEVPINKDEIASTDPSKLSLMPTGFGEILKVEEFNDLMGFLLSKSTGKGAP